MRLFGAFALEVRGRSAPPLSRSVRALLGLLATQVNNHSLDRASVAAMLWPESDETVARYNLRRTLMELRQAMGPEADRLLAPGGVPRTLWLDLTSGAAFCDVIAFDSAVAKGGDAALHTAIDLYQSNGGALLEGERGEWVYPEREARRHAYLTARERLARSYQERGDLEEAIRQLQAVLVLDPTRETVVRDLMIALSKSGQMASALAVYQSLRVQLRKESDAAPDAETTALFKRLYQKARLVAEHRGGTGFDSPTREEPASVTSASSQRCNLPCSLTPLIGREREVLEVTAFLSGDKDHRPARLLMLLGTGGVGKTRLALAVAETVAPDYEEGVCFVDFAPVSASTRLVSVVADALRLTEPASPPAPGDELRFLIDALRSRHLLLLLDNCEHVAADAARLVMALLRACPRLTILATSREPLHVPGEIVWRVPGLAHDDAARLFLVRATEADSRFHPQMAQMEAVQAIVARLDGIPLAIEMAAARTRVLSVTQIAAKLDDVFRLLTVPGGDLLPRHQTLRATLDWSYNLLGVTEQTLLSRLSIFSGGWTLDAAEAVCPIDDAIPAGDVLDLLIVLVEQSLVVYEENTDGEGRYRFLETTRVYAVEKLDSVERAALHTALLRYLLRLAETVKAYCYGPKEPEGLARLEREWPNIQVALTAPAKSDASDDASNDMVDDTADELLALRLATTLQRFWYRRGYLQEGRCFLSVALSQNSAFRKSEAHAAALNTRGALANQQQDTAAALADLEESLAIRRQLGNRRGEAVSLRNIGTTRMYAGDLSAAAAALGECIVLFRDLGEEQRADDNQRLLHEINAARGVNTSHLTDVYRSGLDVAVKQGDRFSEARCCFNLTKELPRRGRVGEAWEYLRRGLSIAFADGHGTMVAVGLELAAEVNLARGDAADIPLLYSAAERLRNETGTPVLTTNQSLHDENRTKSRAALGDAAFDAAWERGQSMNLEQAVAHVLEGR